MEFVMLTPVPVLGGGGGLLPGPPLPPGGPPPLGGRSLKTSSELTQTAERSKTTSISFVAPFILFFLIL